jgi:ornithine cyclodeaminase
VTLNVYTAEQVRTALDERQSEVVDLVASAYRAYYADRSANPASSFLPLPVEPGARSIALTARFGDVFGCKWVSSIPSNPSRGLPRATAMLILNDLVDGKPTAVMDASDVNYARTAGSAVLFAELTGRTPRSVALVGCGPIGRTTLTIGLSRSWEPEQIHLIDPVAAAGDATVAALESVGYRGSVTRGSGVPETGEFDLVVLASSQTSPYISSRFWGDGAVVLNISLRDMQPELHGDGTVNVTDDADQAVGHGTSLGEAVRHGVVSASDIAELDGLLGGAEPSASTYIFSPFGLGILDVAVASGLFPSPVR